MLLYSNNRWIIVKENRQRGTKLKLQLASTIKNIVSQCDEIRFDEMRLNSICIFLLFFFVFSFFYFLGFVCFVCGGQEKWQLSNTPHTHAPHICLLLCPFFFLPLNLFFVCVCLSPHLKRKKIIAESLAQVELRVPEEEISGAEARQKNDNREIDVNRNYIETLMELVNKTK